MDNLHFRRPLEVIAGLLLLIGECFLISAWYNVLVPLIQPPIYIFCILGSVAIGTYLLSLVSNRWNWNETDRRVLFAVWIIIVITCMTKVLLYADTQIDIFQILILPFISIFQNGYDLHEFWHLLLSMLVFWRAGFLANHQIKSDMCLRNCEVSLLFFLCLALFYERRESYVTMLILFAGCLFFILLSLGITRIDETEVNHDSRNVVILPGQINNTVLSTFILTALAILVGLFASDQFATIVTRAIILLFAAMTMLVAVALSPLLSLFLWLASLFPELKESAIANQTAPQNLQTMMEDLVGQSSQNLDYLTINAKPFLMGLILLVLLVATLLSLRRFTIQQTIDKNEERKQLKSRFHLFPQINFKRKNRTRKQKLSHLLAAVRIRYLYAQLMDLCSQLGHARGPAITPIEFLPESVSLFPESGQHLELITRAYIKVRYGEIPETKEEIQAVEDSWENIKIEGKKIMKNKKQ